VTKNLKEKREAGKKRGGNREKKIRGAKSSRGRGGEEEERTPMLICR
jgi:hypothetical protein